MIQGYAKNKKILTTAIVFASLLLGTIWLFWPVWPFEGSNTISAYKLYCPSEYENGLCPEGETTGSIVDFRISPEEKVIRAKTSTGVKRYEDCEIYDNENWKCRPDWLDDFSVTFEMIAGIGREYNRYGFGSHFRYVSEWEYRWRQIKEFFGF